MSVLCDLEQVIRDRKAHPQEGSYTCHLLQGGRQEIAKKVGEEAIEVVLAAVSQSDQRLCEESADLIYHLLVLLAERGLEWSAVEGELEKRRR
jgi:phosphoribosyl-ATP pyrophosphohydrolase